MVNTNGPDGTSRKVSSLGELSRNVAPPRDLWPEIAAQITAANASPDATAGERRRLRPTGMQWAALAAVVAALAVGIWLGRSVMPMAGEDALNRRTAQNQTQSQRPSDSAPLGTPLSRPATEGLPKGTSGAVDPNSQSASFVTDPRYTMQRAALIRGLEEQLKTLPPESQQKVASSLATIRTSIQELQDALGKDPANALLQELLVNSYQDEMRVLTAVHEAGGVSGGI
jgi:hypothetical protein